MVIEGQCSDWLIVKAGVPQGSVLGPLLFLIYINDITYSVSNKCLLYADDTSLFNVVDDPALSASTLNSDLQNIIEWSDNWQVTMNSKKTNSMIISVKRARPFHPPLIMNNDNVKEVPRVNFIFQHVMA